MLPSLGGQPGGFWGSPGPAGPGRSAELHEGYGGGAGSGSTSPVTPRRRSALACSVPDVRWLRPPASGAGSTACEQHTEAQ